MLPFRKYLENIVSLCVFMQIAGETVLKNIVTHRFLSLVACQCTGFP